jgi:hypothetical protein
VNKAEKYRDLDGRHVVRVLSVVGCENYENDCLFVVERRLRLARDKLLNDDFN